MAIKNPGFAFHFVASFILSFILLSSFYTSASHTQEAETETKEKAYTFVAYTNARLGESDRITMIETLDDVCEDIYKKTGIIINYKNLGITDTASYFLQENADLAILTIADIHLLKKRGLDMEPLVMLSAMGKPGSKFCIYADEKYEGLESLRGESFNMLRAGETDGVYLWVREVLLQNGFNMQVEDFFGDILKIPYESSPFQAMLLGKVTAVGNLDMFFEIYATNLPGIDSIKPIACGPEYSHLGIYAKKGLDKEDSAKLMKYFKTLHKNPVLKEFRTFLIAVKAKFVDPEHALIENYENAYKTAVERGWLEEAKLFTVKMSKLEFGQALKKEKKTYKECKEECKEMENEVDCLDKCMGE